MRLIPALVALVAIGCASPAYLLEKKPTHEFIVMMSADEAYGIIHAGWIKQSSAPVSVAPYGSGKLLTATNIVSGAAVCVALITPENGGAKVRYTEGIGSVPGQIQRTIDELRTR